MFGNGFKLAACAALAVLVAPTGATLAQESATGRLQGLSLSSNLPIQIESDKLEVIDGENKAVFVGNVNVSQGPTLMKAGKMTVYYAAGGTGSAATGSGKIDRMEVEDKVYIKSEQQVATGDRGTFDMASQVLTLSGKEVVLSEGKNVLVGCMLTVNMKSGRAQVDGCKNGGNGSGRVMMSISPGSQNR
ncbi:LptA/OstA family protein [Pseudaminobacter soli (ex Zhang et al. 2022)]|nr:LptA/OstA family protein [Pseudaminobacter soli]